MLQKPEFTINSKPEKLNLIKLKVQDLGFGKNPTTDQIYSRAKELGLELCPPEIGPHLRLKYQEVFKREQAKREWLRIGMKQITGSSGVPSVFRVARDDDGKRWLDNDWAKPEDEWNLENEFVFTRK